MNTMNYLNHCYQFSEEDTENKYNFYIVRTLCKFLNKNYNGILILVMKI